MIRLGAFEYVHKSADITKLKRAIQKAIDNFEIRKLEKQLEDQRELEIKYAYNLKTWKEILQSNLDKTTPLILENLRTAFSQGAGFGTLISVINRIKKKSQKENDYYKVPENLMEILLENASISERVVDLLKYQSSLKDSIQLQNVPIKEIYSILFDIALIKMERYAKLKNQKIVLSENKLIQSTKIIKIDKNFFIKIVEELLFNAFKFSIPNSKIFILLEINHNEFLLEVLNSPETNPKGIVGIPDELSKLVFEPFFRISKFIYSEYPTLDFGLGLTFVHEVITEMKGKIFAKNLLSFLDEKKEILTCFQLSFPLKNK